MRILALALVMLSATLATLPTPSDAAATCSSDQPFSRMKADALVAAVQCAQDLNDGGHKSAGQIAGPALLELNNRVGGSRCFQAYPGNGDEVRQWTPRFAVNSPYNGESMLTRATSSTASFKFGTMGSGFDASRTQTETYALSAEKGASLGMFVLLEWTHVHGWNWCTVPPSLQDFWFISDFEPTGTYLQRQGVLTGASNLTDGDNLLVPVGENFTQYPVMGIDVRFKAPDKTICDVSDYRVGTSVSLTAAASFTAAGKNIAGTATYAATDSTAYDVHFKADGLCIQIDELAGQGKAYSVGIDPALNPGFTTFQWQETRDHGCDGPDFIEKVMGEFDTETYGLKVKATDLTHFAGSAAAGDSEVYAIEDRHGNGHWNPVVEDHEVKFDWRSATVASFDGDVSFNVDYEIPAEGPLETYGQVVAVDGNDKQAYNVSMSYRGNRVSFRSEEGAHASVDADKLTKEWVKAALTTLFDSYVPTSANVYFQMACDGTKTVVEELPTIVFAENPIVSHQTWVAKATGDVQGIPAATAYDASYVDVSYGFAPEF